MGNQFIGFGRSSDWLNEINPGQVVNAECVANVGKHGRYGIALATQHIILSQVKDGEVLYLLVPVDRYQTMGTNPMFEEEKHIRRAESAYAVTLDWLKGLGIRARRSMVALPRTQLEGTAEYMRYDKETDTYKAVQS